MNIKRNYITLGYCQLLLIAFDITYNEKSEEDLVRVCVCGFKRRLDGQQIVRSTLNSKYELFM